MKRVAGIATFKGRERCLEIAIRSLEKQVDSIVIYDNEVNPDLTDNGKFYGLTLQKEPCIYYTCDDDLQYPPNYADKMEEEIEIHGCIVTHHGRKLLGLDRSYYRGHSYIRCLGENRVAMELDVTGTGVTAFRTDYFNPVGLHEAKDKKMSDILFALEAAKQGKRIIGLQHPSGWIKQLAVDQRRSIHGTEHNKEERQIELANEIYLLKNETKGI